MTARLKFRILHVLRAPVGGLFRHVCDLATAQSAAGHEVAVVCADGGNALTADLLAHLATTTSGGVHRMASARHPGFGDIVATRHVRALAQRLDSDILHGHGAKGGLYARVAARSTRHRLALYTPHGGSLHYATHPIAGPVVRLVERGLERCGHGIIFESRYAAERYTASVGTPRVPVRIIPNGVGPADFVPVAPAPNASDIVFVGELRHLKGVDVLIDAIAMLASKRTITATIVGDGPDRAAFEALVTARAVSAQIRFTGALPARQAFSLGRVLVMPSRAESFPYIVLEAGACGLPLIATRVGGIPEIVGDSGIPLLPAGDATALAMCLIETLDDPTALRDRTQALRTRIGERLTVSAMAMSIEHMYQDLVALNAARRDQRRIAIAAE